MSDYDSTADTLRHAQRVGEMMMQVCVELLWRSIEHDRSKTEPPELEVFNRVTPRLKELVYGSDEYKAALDDMGEGLAHHYASNRHHPEHFAHGVQEMTLVDVIEMLADWKGATERVKNGNLAESLVIQKDRFHLDEQLVQILENTAVHFGWLQGKARAARPTDNPQQITPGGKKAFTVNNLRGPFSVRPTEEAEK